MAIRVDVALTPALTGARHRPVVVLLDALDGGPAIVALLQGGARTIEVVPLTARARADDGRQFATNSGLVDTAPAVGRDVALATTLARPLARIAGRAARTFVAALLNARAAAHVGLESASDLGVPLLMSCAGPPRGSGPALENVYAAGVLMRRLRDLSVELRLPIELGDGAKLAQALLDHFAGPQEALARSATGAKLVGAGRQSHVALAAQVDVATVVPAVTSHDEAGARRRVLLINWREAPAGATGGVDG